MFYLRYILDGLSIAERESAIAPLVPRVDESVILNESFYKVAHVGYSYNNNDTMVIVSLREYK